MEVGEIRWVCVVNWSFHAESITLLLQGLLCFRISTREQQIHRLQIFINHLVGDNFDCTGGESAVRAKPGEHGDLGPLP
jgi:hypothetical protein